jgi:coenzyme F420-reducing hydrogenase delta subunit
MRKTKDDFDDEELVKVKRQRDELLKTAKDVVLQYRNFDGWISISEIEKFEEIIEEIEEMGKAKGGGE